MTESENSTGQPRIVLFGDQVIDGYHYVLEEVEGERTVEANSTKKNWEVNSQYEYQWVAGGPYLLRDMIDGATDGFDLSLREKIPLRSHAEVRKTKRTAASKEDDEKDWRVSKFGGYFRKAGLSAPNPLDTRINARDGTYRPIVVIDDAGNGIRDDGGAIRAITDSITGGAIVVHKMFLPLAVSDLWKEVAARCTAQDGDYIAIVNAADLRRQGFALSHGLSWTKTLLDLRKALHLGTQADPVANLLGQPVTFPPGVRWLIVRFDCDAVACLSAADQFIFHYDPKAIEGDWDAGHPGDMIGRSSRFTASVVRALAAQPGRLTRDQMSDAAKSGLAASRAFVAGTMAAISKTDGGLERKEPLLPLAEITTETFAKLTCWPAETNVLEKGDFWKQPRLQAEPAVGGPKETAATLLTKGSKELKNRQYCEFGKLVSFDVREMEGYRAAANLFRRRLQGVRPPKPMSIGVFGPPGAGKSFGLKEIVKSLAGDKAQILEFNVAQFGPDSLKLAMHDIRDTILSGKEAFCLFDEFDADSRSYLQRFLAPMQDGSFEDGGKSRPIGPAIFIFLGGTFHNFKQLRDACETKDQTALEAAQRVKLPDFVSRLSGFIDIKGPNPVIGEGSLAMGHDALDADPDCMLRRATVLRNQLWQNFRSLFHGQELSIDTRLARAFLRVPQYRFGTRSMETIIKASSLGPRSTFYAPSALPPWDQLDIHVNAEKFHSLINDPPEK